MARCGQTKVRTGCLTCKIRKVKCDEQRPSCVRCVSTGRKCDGYRIGVVPVGNPSKRLARSLSTLAQNASPSELRALDFFADVVVKALADPLDISSWTHKVMQVAESVPAVRHAVIAVSEHYESFGEPKTPRSIEHTGLRHYNSAIRHVLDVKNTNCDIVLLVCVLFVCLEFLRGDAHNAIAHVEHGLRILASGHDSNLLPVFRQLLIFPFFFARTLPKHMAVVAEGETTTNETFKTSPQARAALDLLSYQVIRLVRMADYHRLGLGDEVLPLETARAEQRRLRNGLRQWGDSFSISRHTTESEDLLSSLRILVIRWLVMGIWVETCLAQNEVIYDNYQDTFERIIVLAASIRHPSGGFSAKFSFTRGFSPLLHFVVIKCRHLHLRLKALVLLKSLSRDRESLWDKDLLYATGRRIIELEHSIELPANIDSDCFRQADGSAILPSDEQRITDNMLQDDVEVCGDVHGMQVTLRKICFLMKDEAGGVKSIYEWITTTA